MDGTGGRRLARGAALIAATIAISGCAFLPVITADPGGPGSPLRILAPGNRSQLASVAAVPVQLSLSPSVDQATLHVTLFTGTKFGAGADLTGRLVFGGGGSLATVMLGPADISPGLSDVVAVASTPGGPVEVSAVFSWEPAVDVTTADRCEFLGQSRCMLPFPDDWYTRSDGTTDTGRRVDFKLASMPANTSNVHVDPTEWNRNDGFSPGSMIVTHVPGVDPGQTGAAPITDIQRSLDAGAPIVVVDAATGEHVPFFAELDAGATTEAQRALILRPVRNLREAHRYIVAMREMKDSSGTLISPGRAFQVYRDLIPTFIPVVEARRSHMEDLFGTLGAAGIGRADLYLAWDFTVASERNLSERVLHIRDDAFASLGGAAPAFTIGSVQDNVDTSVFRRVTGTFQVPNYLTGTGAPGSRFNNGPDGLPTRNGNFTANFICNIPRSATASGGDPVTPGRALVYGHGLLGSATEVNSFGALANAYDAVMCATDWVGMSTADIPNVGAILLDLSKFPTLADRLQQAFLDFQFLARLMKDPNGFASNAAFRAGAGNTPVLTTGEVFFNGNSQGGILGGAATAISTEWTRAVLGVPAMNFSTLLSRSVDWETFAPVNYGAYPDPLDRSIGFSAVQMLWDRAEADGYALHMTDDPLPNTPKHKVLLEEAFGDHQVTNIATETEARTIGAHVYQPALAAGRDTAVTPMWGIPAMSSFPFDGVGLVMWDYGTPAPPTTNTPNHAGTDPHGLGAFNPRVAQQVTNWLQHDGFFVDLCSSGPCHMP